MAAAWEAMQAVWRMPSNVEWCEAQTDLFRHSEHIAEFWNTISNVCFIAVGAYGWRRAARLGMPTSFFFTEGMMVVVGLGSMVFHARRNYFGEVLDELPMSLMALGWMWCLDGLHVSLQKSARLWTVLVMGAITACSWISYVIFHSHFIFTSLFTFQVLVPALVSLCAVPALGGVLCSRRWQWWAFLFGIIIGKSGWELERWLHRNNKCPVIVEDPRFWLHPLWHFCSAASHCIWMQYATQLVVNSPRGKTE